MSQGYEQTAVSMIVKKVGVAQGTFYYHFASKEVILEAIFDRYIRNMLFAFQSASAGQQSVKEKLQLFCNFFYRLCFCDEASLLTQVLYREKQGQMINRLWRQTLVATAPILQCMLEQGNREGITKVEHMEETLAFFAGIMAALLEASSPDEFGHEADRDKINNKLGIAGRLLEALLGLPADSIRFDCIGQDAADRQEQIRECSS
ncbi:hypothetical protein P22_3961 [Propionispora sp. 2/2-37]|nr:hypothetical protein P22_3961 [Propionispora sp. 2/2-37]